MTTLLPGASDVLTQGLTVSPRSTAFLASSAAPIITDGFEVLVHDVIEAIDDGAVVELELAAVGRPDRRPAWTAGPSRPASRAGSGGRGGAGRAAPTAGESLAGKDSADASSTPLRMPSSSVVAPA